MIDQRIKERAYQLDPECWVSYSGKPKEFKQRVDKRRTSALERAKIQLEAEGVQLTDDDNDGVTVDRSGMFCPHCGGALFDAR